MKNNILVGVLVILTGLSASSLTYIYTQPEEKQVFGSVTTGQDYYSTSTPIGTAWTDQTIKVGSGSLGSVIVGEAGDQWIRLYDATSTGALSTGNLILDNILLAEVRGDATGTFVYDVAFNNGLVLDVVEGTLATSTITYR